MAESISLPLLRWGVLGTGWISTKFTQDLLLAQTDAGAEHAVVAVGSSSLAKGEAFVGRVWKETPDKARPRVYADYHDVYNDKDVDIVYVGTPHSLHKQNCLDAIAAGKHVLCEKPFTVNEAEAKLVVDAARAKGVFVMEAVWTRFCPLFDGLREEILTKNSIGEVQRLFIDFGKSMHLEKLPKEHRQRDPALGAGALLDIGIYSLTYASIIMGQWQVGKDHPTPSRIRSSLDIVNGIDEANVVILDYDTGLEGRFKTAICSSSFRHTAEWDFARIEGTRGTIIISGLGPSFPASYRVLEGSAPGLGEKDSRVEREFKVERRGNMMGFAWEANAVARDIANGLTENATMPLDETMRMMKLMDDIRRQGGLVYPQDEQEAGQN